MVAKQFLIDLIANRNVRCQTRSIDLYKRQVAICYADEEELNRVMVQNGMAIAYTQYSKRYLADELLAKNQFLGIWDSSFMEPERFRKYRKYIAKKQKIAQDKSR